MTDQDQPHDPTDEPLAHPADPGAYVGNRPERQAETVPGGVRPGDERIAANSSEPARRRRRTGPNPARPGQNR